MTDAEWSDVFDVHVGGTYSCLRAVWPVMMAQRRGRIVLTTTSGVFYGNFGQANYLAAKGAIVSLTRTLAIEGASRGIFVNAIAPIAVTRLTEGIIAEEAARVLPVEGVSPFVLAMVHPSSTETGAIIEAGGGWAAKMRWERSAGKRFAPNECNVSQVLAHWDDIVRFDERAEHPDTVLDSMVAVVGPEIGAKLRTAAGG
jgi:NAD(P)-dependent dehydrogenase (short-subunit alcohol dehydrogenase family)